jgi:hypothetical protein
MRFSAHRRTAFVGNRKEGVIGFDNAFHKRLAIVEAAQCTKYLVPPHESGDSADFASLSRLADTVALHHALQKELPSPEVLFRPA